MKVQENPKMLIAVIAAPGLECNFSYNYPPISFTEKQFARR
jgi:hypothetical protein